MATKLHSTLTGSDLHPNKIDGTTGTELTVASQNAYDNLCWLSWPRSLSVWCYAALT
jgi:hypothetical protein